MKINKIKNCRRYGKRNNLCYFQLNSLLGNGCMRVHWQIPVWSSFASGIKIELLIKMLFIYLIFDLQTNVTTSKVKGSVCTVEVNCFRINDISSRLMQI